MLHTLWQRGIVSLTLATVCAALLLAAPPEVVAWLRDGLRDCLLPGARAFHAVESGCVQLQSHGRDLLQLAAARVSGSSAPRREVEPGRDKTLQARVRQLEAVAAHLRRRLQSAEEQLTVTGPQAPSESLLKISTARARVIGRERSSLERLAGSILDAGTSEGVAAESLVLEALDEESPSAVVIDRGRDAALEADLPVADGRTLVGRIRSVGRVTSSVQLASDPEFRVGARILRTSSEGPVEGAAGIFAGGGSEPCRLELVPAIEPVAVGDRVYTHEAVGGFALRLYVGEITRAEVSPGDSHWKIEVRPALAEMPQTVEVVRVELNPARLALDDAVLSQGASR